MVIHFTNFCLKINLLLMLKTGNLLPCSPDNLFSFSDTLLLIFSEDKADVVGFLKRMLQQRTDSITELTDRLEGMKVSSPTGWRG